MTDPLDDLARIVVTLPGWRWMRGMTSIWGHDETDSDRPMLWLVSGPDSIGPHGNGAPGYNPRCIPDLSDPATVGCVHDLVEEACGGPVGVTAAQWAGADGHGVKWGAYRIGGRWLVQGPTRIHALVALWQEVSRG